MLEPLPASTLVICRITEKWPHKILLIKRSSDAKFLPGAHVFPGGRCEEQDQALGQWLASDVENYHRIEKYFSPEHLASTHVATAIRETLEETGLSVARTSTGPMTARDLGNAIDDPARSTLPDLGALWPISWWITPLGEVRRFDTWFFLTMVEDSPALDHCAGDHHEGNHDFRWLTPTDALAAYANGEVFLPPPTRTILERMAATISLEDFLSYVDCPLTPICPFFNEVDRENLLILPGDPLHHQQERPKFLLHTRYAFP